jgi:hypothetical protein
LSISSVQGLNSAPQELEFPGKIIGSMRSTISLLTMPTTDNLSSEYATITASAVHTTPLSGNKRPASVLEPNFSPSPSKNYPDYSITKSSGNSVASGNDSGQWEDKGERILAAHMRKMQAE